MNKCLNCGYYDGWWGSCFNGESPHRGDIMDGDDVCDCWEVRNEKDSCVDAHGNNTDRM